MVLLTDFLLKIIRGKILFLSPLFFLLISPVFAREEIIFYSSDCPECLKTAKKFEQCFGNDFNIIYADTRIPSVRRELKTRSEGRMVFPPCAYFNGKIYSQDELFTIAIKNISAPKTKRADTTLGYFTIAGAGLLDGINPCALTVIVFFISISFRSGIRILLPVISLVAGVFSAYFLTGLISSKILYLFYHSSFFTLINLIIQIITLFLCLLSAIDLFLFIKNSKSKFLHLPTQNIRKIHEKIKQNLQMKSKPKLCISSFFCGVIISFFELLCTGQIYLPVLNFIIKQDGRFQAFKYLLIYNLAFIVPLLTVSATGNYIFKNSQKMKKIEFIFRVLIPLLFLWLFYINMN